MGKNSKIEWCDHTFNPVWGCQKVSPGCQNCYADTMARRTGHNVWGPTAPRRRTGPGNWGEVLKWDRNARAMGRRARVFCASMADVFEEHPDWEPVRPDLWRLIESTRNLDWLLLTKRPENVMAMVPETWRTAFPPNVWLGTSVESQEWAEKRIPHLLQVPARVRFVSCEPLLGMVGLSHIYMPRRSFGPDVSMNYYDALNGRATFGSKYAEPQGPIVHWVICGGESGPHARPMDPEDALYLRIECLRAGTPFFMKQMGGKRDKGAALDSIPTDLQIRQFPAIIEVTIERAGGG